MCRNIKILYNFQPPTTEDEVNAAAVQYVRKVSGMQKPSQANEATFERAVQAIAEVTQQLLDELVTQAPPRDREVEAEKRRARSPGRQAADPCARWESSGQRTAGRWPGPRRAQPGDTPTRCCHARSS